MTAKDAPPMDPSMTLTLFLLLGVAQGIFLAVLLLTRRENAAANRILAGAMMAFAVYLAEVSLYAGDNFRSFPHLIGISQPVIFLFGPVIYLYARTVSGGGQAPGRRAPVHYLPAVAVILYFLPFYLKTGAEKIAFVEAIMAGNTPLDVRIIDWLKLPHGAVYTLVTFGVLGRYRRRLEANFSTLDRINLRWLQYVLVGALVIWGVAIANFILIELRIRLLDTASSPASLVLVVFVYVIGVLGLRQPEVFWPPAAEEAPEENPPDPDQAGKYRKSGLAEDRAAALQDDLLQVMQEHRPHADPGLTLSLLAEMLMASPHNLSEVINSRLGKSFHDFVNGYRVEEAKDRLLDPALAHQTILAVALESGFRSKSTFNKIFKRFTGVTPSDFRRNSAAA